MRTRAITSSLTRAAASTLTRRRAGGFSPAALLAGSTAFAWYDPSDLTTMFQDSAGTTPVTAPAQTVARINDKSGNGFHAVQSGVSTLRPTYGVVPATGRVNLLTYSEEFNNAAWVKFGTVSVTANSVTAPDGTQTADTVAISAASGVYQTVSAVPLTTYTASIWVRADSSVTGRLVVNTNLGDPVFQTINATTQWQRVSLSKATQAGTTSVSVQLDAGNGANTIYVWGAQLETGSTATAYQKVVSQFEVTEAGVPSLSHLSFDGVDDFLVTSTITPSANKMQVFAGLRKLSDAASFPVLAELSVASGSNSGVFLLSGRSAGAAGMLFQSKGTVVASSQSTTSAAPFTQVVTGLGDISAPSSQIRTNQVAVSPTTTSQGTGNYLAYAMYLGRRGGASNALNMQLYGLIVRFSTANLDSSLINQTERWMASKTGVVL